MLRGAFIAVAGVTARAIFMAVISLIGVGLVVRDMRASRGSIRPIIFVGMLAEAIAIAATIWRRDRVGDGKITRHPSRARDRRKRAANEPAGRRA